MRITNLHGIEEALSRGEGLRCLYAGKSDNPRVRAIIEKARSMGLAVQILDRKQLDQVASGQDCRGAVLEMTGEAGLSMEFSDLLALMRDQVESGRQPVLIALDGVTDPHNLGAILRSADKLGASAVIVPRRRSAADGPVVQAASAGAANHVPLVTAPNLVRGLEDLKKIGFWIWGADMGGEAIHRTDSKVPLVLVMGSEGDGISTLGRKTCDRLVSISCGGHVDSLNVSNATAVLLYEIWRQRDFAF